MILKLGLGLEWPFSNGIRCGSLAGNVEVGMAEVQPLHCVLLDPCLLMHNTGPAVATVLNG